MSVLLFCSVFAGVLSLILVVLGKVLGSPSMFMEHEKKSPFECGFDTLSSMRVPFSTRFFLLAVIFLIFDVEIVLLLPTLFMWKLKRSLFLMASLLVFLLILLVGTYHEWNEGSLDWAEEV